MMVLFTRYSTVQYDKYNTAGRRDSLLLFIMPIPANRIDYLIVKHILPKYDHKSSRQQKSRSRIDDEPNSDTVL